MALHIPAPIRRHPLVTGLSFVIVAPIVLMALWTTITLHYTYSSGERSGFLQKTSKKGWICKTWEGELQVTAIPGSVPEKFTFSTRSDSIADLLNKMNGQRVVLNYAQHVHVPSSCFGETEYFITGVRTVAGQ
ncbi:MAG: hypothetical protein ABI442_02075 [Gemmatimonadaceae bacterium]